MGDGGYWILLADGFGAGLVLLNPRLHTEGLDMHGNPRNWWPKRDGDDEKTVLERHGLLDRTEGGFCNVLFGA